MASWTIREQRTLGRPATQLCQISDNLILGRPTDVADQDWRISTGLNLFTMLGKVDLAINYPAPPPPPPHTHRNMGRSYAQ